MLGDAAVVRVLLSGRGFDYELRCRDGEAWTGVEWSMRIDEDLVGNLGGGMRWRGRTRSVN